MTRSFLVVALVAASLNASDLQNVPILAYHEVDPLPERGWAVQTEEFRDEMDFLAAAGYHVIPIADFYDYLIGKRDSLPSDPVIITVDDGWLCAYTDIGPILQKHQFPWSLYVYPAIVGQGTHSLNWSQIKELSDDGVDVEGHTMTHAHLSHRSHVDLNDSQYVSWLHDELAGSKSAIEEKTGRPVRFLAYPYGEHDAAIEQEAAEDGYAAGLTSEVGINTRSTSPLRLKRFPITSDTTLEQFCAGIGAVTLPLDDLAPAAESVIKASQRSLSAIVVDKALLDPKTVGMTVLGVQHGSATYEPSLGRISYAWKGSLPAGRHRAVVWGNRADGLRFASVWTFYTSEGEKARYEVQRKQLLELPLHHTDTRRPPQ
ncbi:MAG TPA: polysaccharide deacetylase family protein [Thermoanaerobaculia bacterium]